MPLRGMSVGAVRRRFVVASLVVAALVTAGTIYAITTGYHQRAHYSSQNRLYRTPGSVTPTASEQAATLAVTVAYRRSVVRASQNFAVAVDALAADIRGRDLAGARHEELLAQGAIDVLRPNVASGLSALMPLDALIADQPAGSMPTGLHAVERDLWTGRLAAAAAPTGALVDSALEVEVALYRTVVTPTQACANLQELLGWSVNDVIDSPQEIYSHDDLIDVEAVVGATRATEPSLVRLGNLVAPVDTAALVAATTHLETDVSSLSPSSSDALVTVSTWRRLAQDLDVESAALGRLGGDLFGFGTGRTYA